MRRQSVRFQYFLVLRKATKGNKAIAHPQRVAMGGGGRAARAFVRVGVPHVGGLAMQHDGYDALPEHIAKAWHGMARHGMAWLGLAWHVHVSMCACACNFANAPLQR